MSDDKQPKDLPLDEGRQAHVRLGHAVMLETILNTGVNHPLVLDLVRHAPPVLLNQIASLVGQGPMLAASGQEDKPAWGDEEATLYWRGKPIRVFRHGAQNQRDIIEAFHRASWARFVDSPFTAENTLRQTVYDLNQKIPKGSIWFRCDGTGERVCWAACPAE